MMVLLVFLVLASMAVCLCVFSRDHWALYLLFFLIALQNFCGILFSNLKDPFFVQMVLALKEVLVYGAVFAAAVLSDNIRRILFSKSFIALIIILLVYFAMSPAGLMAKLTCCREIITPIILFCFGVAIVIDEKKLLAFVRLLIRVIGCCTVFGFIEAYVVGANFWVNLGMISFCEIKGFSPWLNNQGVPASFYSYDFYNYLGYGVRRMASVIAEPIAFGHLSALCFSILLLGWDRLGFGKQEKSVLITMVGLGALLSLSKGALLIVTISVLTKMYAKRNMLFYPVVFILLGIAVFLFANMTTSMSNHLLGFIESFRENALFGTGIGTGGNYSGLYGGDASIPRGGESFFGALIVQTGLLGAVVYLGFFLNCIIKVCQSISQYAKTRSTASLYGVMCFIVGCFVEALVSESALGFIGSGIGFALFGIMYRIARNSKLEYLATSNPQGKGADVFLDTSSRVAH